MAFPGGLGGDLGGIVAGLLLIVIPFLGSTLSARLLTRHPRLLPWTGLLLLPRLLIYWVGVQWGLERWSTKEFGIGLIIGMAILLGLAPMLQKISLKMEARQNA